MYFEVNNTAHMKGVAGTRDECMSKHTWKGGRQHFLKGHYTVCTSLNTEASDKHLHGADTTILLENKANKAMWPSKPRASQNSPKVTVDGQPKGRNEIRFARIRQGLHFRRCITRVIIHTQSVGGK